MPRRLRHATRAAPDLGMLSPQIGRLLAVKGLQERNKSRMVADNSIKK